MQAQSYLHSQAYQGDADPAAQTHENRFSAGFYKLYDIGVETDSHHCHDDKEFGQRLEG